MEIVDYISKIKAEKDAFEKRILQIKLFLLTRIRAKTIENINTKLNKTQREGSNGKTKSASTGGLVDSVMLMAVGRDPYIEVGNENVPYAAIHELGGIIRAKNVDYLTIPASPKFVGTRAADWKPNLYYEEDSRGRPFLALKQAGRRQENPVVAFWLRKSVKMPKRPYLRPAAEEIFNDSVVKERLGSLFPSPIYEVKT